MIISSIEKPFPFRNWLFTFIWFALTVLFLFIILNERSAQSNPLMWIAFVLFLLPGIFCLHYDIYRFSLWRRHGAVVLHISNGPKIGGKLSGNLVFSKAIKPGQELELTLTCNHRLVSWVKTGKGKYSRQGDEEVISKSGGSFITSRCTTGEVVMNFSLNVPSSGKPSKTPIWFYRNGHSYYFWILSVESECEGVNFYRSFPILVN